MGLIVIGTVYLKSVCSAKKVGVDKVVNRKVLGNKGNRNERRDIVNE